MKQLTELETWKSLVNHADHIRSYANDDIITKNTLTPKLPDKITSKTLNLDYSCQHISKVSYDLLVQLAIENKLKEKIHALFTGEPVNSSEKKPALHTALRRHSKEPIHVNGKNIVPDIHMTLLDMKQIADKIRSKQWLGYSGKPITDIINIGIGGSDLGPRLCIKALSDYTEKDLHYHFISDADPDSFNEVIQKINQETSLFIVSSKSFNSKETLYNAQKAILWIKEKSSDIADHFIAVTANEKKAKALGINTTLPIWDWVGGRYSACSAINLICCIAIGFENFQQFLAGAESMDQHFYHRDFHNNLPVILALLGIWNINFLHYNNLLMLNYINKLEPFIPYVQQLDMESNGKSIDIHGRSINYATSPIVWGGSGNQAQHSYYQMLCQGTHKIAIDFISLQALDGLLINDICEKNKHILSNGVHQDSNPNHYIPGNLPINHISMSECSPFSLGELIALYEHKIFTQACIWNINPFDQPGVESAKENDHLSSKEKIY